jgi:DNA-binding Lrp family transcriptional regulator
MDIKLDKIDKRILFELDKNARIPDTQLAKLVGRSKESVRYRIKRLEDLGVILGFSSWIDLSKIGFISAKIYLNLANDPKKKKELLDYVKQDKRLFWLGVAEGAWNVGLTYFVKSNREFFDLKNELFSKFKELILKSDTGVLVDVNISHKTFLHNSPNQWKTLFADLEDYKLEEIEKEVLKELHNNSRVHVVDIAVNNKSTVDIVRNRIKKLEEKGIIAGYFAKIDFSKINYEFFKTFLYFKNLTNEDETRLLNYCKLNKKIINLVRQISPWDIELEVMCESYKEYNNVLSSLSEEFSSIISKTETAIMGENYLFPSKKFIFE